MIHCMADGAGMIQFIKAVADLASGKQDPVVHPVWQRELLMARCPPSFACVSPKLDLVIIKRDMQSTATSSVSLEDDNNNKKKDNMEMEMESQYFIFGPQNISTLRNHIIIPDECSNDNDPNLGRRTRSRTTTTFELLTAVIWRCRTVALGYDGAGQRSRLAFVANARRKITQLIAADGYYGNALVLHVVDAAAGELCSGGTLGLGHTVGLIRSAKLETTDEHLRSTVDYLASLRAVAPSTSSLTYDRTAYFVSDVTSLGEDRLDLGWAEWIAGGRATPSSLVSNYRKCRNSAGEDAIAVSMVLPRPAMDRFRKEIAAWLLKVGNATR